MARLMFVAGILFLLVGCQSNRMGKTPTQILWTKPEPPRDFPRLGGAAVPDWRPEDMIAGPRGAVSPLSWHFLGPMPITDEWYSGPGDASGRVVSIAIHPTNPNIVYIGSASGGVWKSSNGGQQWTPLTDELSNLNHGCVAIDPSDPETIYAGTGEYQTGLTGDGLFRSTDGGMMWDRVATVAQVSDKCSQIIVDPSDPLRIHLTGGGGYIRSDDGGATWTSPLPLGKASAMVIHPDDPLTLYVGHVPDGIYRSADGGTTWTLLTNGLPAIATGRVVLDIVRSNPNVLYAAIAEEGVSIGVQGVYKTVDGGDTWTQTGATPSLGSINYNLCLAVDPSDEDTVYLGGFHMQRTTNGGASWNDITNSPQGGTLHVDQHTVTFGPDGSIWVGNDGGVWKSLDDAQSWINVNNTLGVTQFYGVTVHPTDPNRLIGGSQDNGTSERGSDGNAWQQIRNGDTGPGAFDPDDPSLRYSAGRQMTVIRHNGALITNISGPWLDDSFSGAYPFMQDPNDAHTLVAGTNRIWRTTDAHAGANWTDLSGGPQFGSFTAIDIADGAPDTIYAGNNVGQIHVTTDAFTWEQYTLGVGFNWVMGVDVNPNDPAEACLTIANLVKCTDDYGATWTDLAGSIPAGLWTWTLAVDWRFDPPAFYLGTAVGVYSSSDGGVIWAKDGVDLPNVSVRSLVIAKVNNTITAGTYGRGIWRSDLPVIASPGDYDGDGDIDLMDYAAFVICLTGPIPGSVAPGCDVFDFELDDDIDLAEFGTFQNVFTGSLQ